LNIAQWFDMKVNPIRLSEGPILVEQLRLTMSNVGAAVVPSTLLALSMVWALSNHDNALALWIWCAVEIVSTLNMYRYARGYLSSVIPVDQSRCMAKVLVLMNAVHGLIWGVLSWITMGTSDPTSIVLVVAVACGIVGAAMATTSAVPLVFIAFALPQLGVMAAKLWLLGYANYRVLSIAMVLYLISLLGQALNSARATRDAIEIRFKLLASQKQLHEIEQREVLRQERRRLMQDLHDGLGSSLRTALWAVEKGNIDEHAVVSVLKSCIDDMKLAVDSMEPVQTDLLLLLATLRFRLDPRLENTGIDLHWDVIDVPALDWLDPKSALHILRILQEAFTNVIKHAHATEIRVATSVDGPWAVVTISDNGAGFLIERAPQSGGKGLANQMHRAQSIGAEIALESGDFGTLFSLRLPIVTQSNSGTVV
jgi:signal transduction histidine kinase